MSYIPERGYTTQPRMVSVDSQSEVVHNRYADVFVVIRGIKGGYRQNHERGRCLVTTVTVRLSRQILAKLAVHDNDSAILPKPLVVRVPQNTMLVFECHGYAIVDYDYVYPANGEDTQHES